MVEILSLRSILDICARQNGKTTTIVEDCTEHLLVGNGVLVVVTFNSISVKNLTREICNNLTYRNLDIILRHSQVGHIISEYGSRVKLLEFNNLFNTSTLCGMTVNDIIFDCPELLFDTRILELSHRL